MNSAGKHAVIALLVISIAGCAEKKTVVTPPVTAQAPPTDTGKTGAMYPPPLTPTETEPVSTTPPPEPTVAKSEPPPPPPPEPAKTKKTPSTTHKQKPSAAKPAANGAGDSTDTQAANTSTTTTPVTSGTPAAEAPPTVAEGGEPAAASPIGQLSTGDVADQAQARKDTVDLITSTENGLNGIKRTLSSQEQETANQIRTFLKNAKQALSNDDLDGAHTLATKAKVLLDELNKT
jgi:hypothetical protein